MSQLLCASCQQPATSMCSNCRKAYYCSVACQKTHAVLHTPVCRAPKTSSTSTVCVPKTSPISEMLRTYQDILGASVDAEQNHVVNRHIADALHRHVVHLRLYERTQSRIGDEIDDRINAEYQKLQGKKKAVDQLMRKKDNTPEENARLLKKSQKLARQLADNRRRAQNVMHNRLLKPDQMPWHEILRHVPDPVASLKKLSQTSLVFRANLAHNYGAGNPLSVDLARKMDLPSLKVALANAIKYSSPETTGAILEAQKYRTAEEKISAAYFFSLVGEMSLNLTKEERGMWHVIANRDPSAPLSSAPITDRRMLTCLALRDYGLRLCEEFLTDTERQPTPWPREFLFPWSAYYFVAGFGTHLQYVQRFTAALRSHSSADFYGYSPDDIIESAMLSSAKFDNDTIFQFLFQPYVSANGDVRASIMGEGDDRLVLAALQHRSWTVLRFINDHVKTVNGTEFKKWIDEGSEQMDYEEGDEDHQERLRDETTKSILIRCVSDDDIEAVTWLLDHGADIRTDFYDQTATNFTHSPQMLRLLVERGGDLYSGRKEDFCVFDAIHYKDLSLIDLILSKAQYGDPMLGEMRGHMGPVYSAVRTGNLQIVQRMTNARFVVKAMSRQNDEYGEIFGPSPLELSVSEGFTEITKHLIDCLKPNARGGPDDSPSYSPSSPDYPPILAQPNARGSPI